MSGNLVCAQKAEAGSTKKLETRKVLAYSTVVNGFTGVNCHEDYHHHAGQDTNQ